MRAVHGSPNQTEQRKGVASKERNGVWSRGSRHLSLKVKADGAEALWSLLRGALGPSL